MAFLSTTFPYLLLLIFSVVEVGLVSSMVGFLHTQKTEVKTYEINWSSPPFILEALPEHLLVDQGHTTNGAAGYGFVLGVAGLISIWLQGRWNMRQHMRILQTFAVLLLLSTLLSLSAFIFTFVVTYQTTGQVISSVAAHANEKYPVDKWTPENWFKALIELPLTDESLRGTFRTHVHLMEAWRWWLIPLFLVNVFAFTMATLTVLRQRRMRMPEMK